MTHSSFSPSLLKNCEGSPLKSFLEGAASLSYIDWSPLFHSGSSLVISNLLHLKMPVLPCMLIFNFYLCVATPFSNFRFFSRESPLTSLPPYNCSNQIFELAFHAAPHIGCQLSREVFECSNIKRSNRLVRYNIYYFFALVNNQISIL